MNEFIKELMQETVHFGMYDGEVPDYIISGLLQKHFGIKLEVSMYHFRPVEVVKKSAFSSFMPAVYGEVIAEQLEQTTFFLGKDKNG